MLATIESAAVIGIEAYSVTVEVDSAQGLPQFTVVGLAAAAVKESRERVAAALVNSGFALPPRRLTVNLAPADVRKDGTAFDLPIALGVLVATGQLNAAHVEHIVALAELALDGTLRSVRGVLSVARLVARLDSRTLIIPPTNAREATLVAGLPISAPSSLAALVAALRRGERVVPVCETPAATTSTDATPDFRHVVGQRTAKRALEIAAAGDHGVILIGPPGAGKTLLARCMPGLLPALDEREALEVIAIHSVAGVLSPERALDPARPFRAPHHTVSTAGLIGGSSPPRPGEVSLAHRGVLFLDEMLEFPRHTLDAMRQPMEDGEVVIARATGSVRFPARFTLVGAMNPCPCGRAGDPTAPCVCSAADIGRYRARLSGPLEDRIDLHVPVRAVPVRDLGASATDEPSAAVRARVVRARERQRLRVPMVAPSTPRHGRQLLADESLDAAARALLTTAAERLRLSARGFHRVLRVARTIADLEGGGRVSTSCVAEALRYRPLSPATVSAVAEPETA